MSGEICGSCSDKVTILTPFPGWNEIDPDDLWNKIVKVRNLLRKKLRIKQVQQVTQKRNVHITYIRFYQSSIFKSQQYSQ